MDKEKLKAEIVNYLNAFTRSSTRRSMSIHCTDFGGFDIFERGYAELHEPGDNYNYCAGDDIYDIAQTYFKGIADEYIIMCGIYEGKRIYINVIKKAYIKESRIAFSSFGDQKVSVEITFTDNDDMSYTNISIDELLRIHADLRFKPGSIYKYLKSGIERINSQLVNQKVILTNTINLLNTFKTTLDSLDDAEKLAGELSDE